MALIGTPAAMRPISGTLPERMSANPGGGDVSCGVRRALPSMTLGEKPVRRCWPASVMASGSLMTSIARARCGRRRMKPRSSSAMIRRCTPDFDCSASASFISSKEGGTPVSWRRALMKTSSSFCLVVSMKYPRVLQGATEADRTNREQHKCSGDVLQPELRALLRRVLRKACEFQGVRSAEDALTPLPGAVSKVEREARHEGPRRCEGGVRGAHQEAICLRQWGQQRAVLGANRGHDGEAVAAGGGGGAHIVLARSVGLQRHAGPCRERTCILAGVAQQRAQQGHEKYARAHQRGDGIAG